MARPFKICPDCGAHLDASEPCDCKDTIEREPPKPWERLKLLAVCREVDKESGRVSVYPLDLEITSEILASLKMRAQFNPELRYFTTTTARWDRYGEVMAGTPKEVTQRQEHVRFGQNGFAKSVCKCGDFDFKLSVAGIGVEHGRKGVGGLTYSSPRNLFFPVRNIVEHYITSIHFLC